MDDNPSSESHTSHETTSADISNRKSSAKQLLNIAVKPGDANWRRFLENPSTRAPAPLVHIGFDEKEPWFEIDVAAGSAFMRELGFPHQFCESWAVAIQPKDFLPVQNWYGIFALEIMVTTSKEEPRFCYPVILIAARDSTQSMNSTLLHELGHAHRFIVKRKKLRFSMTSILKKKCVRRVVQALFVVLASVLGAMVCYKSIHHDFKEAFLYQLGVLASLITAYRPLHIAWLLTPEEWRAIYFEHKYRHITIIRSCEPKKD